MREKTITVREVVIESKRTVDVIDINGDTYRHTGLFFTRLRAWSYRHLINKECVVLHSPSKTTAVSTISHRTTRVTPMLRIRKKGFLDEVSEFLERKI